MVPSVDALFLKLTIMRPKGVCDILVHDSINPLKLYRLLPCLHVVKTGMFVQEACLCKICRAFTKGVKGFRPEVN